MSSRSLLAVCRGFSQSPRSLPIVFSQSGRNPAISSRFSAIFPRSSRSLARLENISRRYIGTNRRRVLEGVGRRMVVIAGARQSPAKCRARDRIVCEYIDVSIDVGGLDSRIFCEMDRTRWRVKLAFLTAAFCGVFVGKPEENRKETQGKPKAFCFSLFSICRD